MTLVFQVSDTGVCVPFLAVNAQCTWSEVICTSDGTIRDRVAVCTICGGHNSLKRAMRAFTVEPQSRILCGVCMHACVFIYSIYVCLYMDVRTYMYTYYVYICMQDMCSYVHACMHRYIRTYV